MKPARFDYACPRSLDEALALLESRGEEAKLLAGGQSLVPMLNLRLAQPRSLIDLNRIGELSFVRNEAGALRIGALSRHRQIEVSAEVEAAQPLLARAGAEVGHLAIRNRGTIGGSLVHADPAAEWPLIAVVLNAQLILRSRGKQREVTAREFFVGPLTTAIEPNELLTEIRFPASRVRSTWGFQELCRRPGDFALAAVACQLVLDGERRCLAASLGVGGAHPTPLVVSDANRVLEGCRGEAEALGEAAELATKAVEPTSDVHGSADFRRRLVKVLTLRALNQAWNGTGNGQVR